MITALKSRSNEKASASVVDGKLILSFPHAQTPVLWQMDLVQAKASALEVLKEEKADAFSLTLKTQKGEKVQVAAFETREEALHGLMAASKALQNAHGNILMAANEDKNVAFAPAATKKRNKGKWLTGLLAIAALVVLFGVWAQIAPKPPTSIQYANNTGASGPGTTSATESAGVPVSADDFLSGL